MAEKGRKPAMKSCTTGCRKQGTSWGICFFGGVVWVWERLVVRCVCVCIGEGGAEGRPPTHPPTATALPCLALPHPLPNPSLHPSDESIHHHQHQHQPQPHPPTHPPLLPSLLPRTHLPRHLLGAAGRLELPRGVAPDDAAHDAEGEGDEEEEAGDDGDGGGGERGGGLVAPRDGVEEGPDQGKRAGEDEGGGDDVPVPALAAQLAVEPRRDEAVGPGGEHVDEDERGEDGACVGLWGHGREGVWVMDGLGYAVRALLKQSPAQPSPDAPRLVARKTPPRAQQRRMSVVRQRWTPEPISAAKRFTRCFVYLLCGAVGG